MDSAVAGPILESPESLLAKTLLRGRRPMPRRTRGIHRRRISARRPQNVVVHVVSSCFLSPVSQSFAPCLPTGQFGLADSRYDELVAELENAGDTEAKYAKALELSGGEKRLQKHKEKSRSALQRHWKLVGV